MHIPFNRPAFTGNEERYIAEAIANGHISGDGSFTKRCHSFLESQLEVPKVLLTTSCTDALEMAALLLDIKDGDEVIVPSFTFVSSVNAFVLRGACPVFADIRPDTLNIDETKLESLVTSRTKAIVVVHYAGVSCEMEAILEVAAKHDLKVIEDNAHGLFGTYRGKPLGTFGSLATQSFHETKNFTCGEGGALLINDTKYLDRAEIIREKGTNRSRFFRKQVDKYMWVDLGSSYLPSDLLAAILYAQLEKMTEIQDARSRIWQRYFDSLKDWAMENKVGLPTVPDYCEQTFHMFYMLLPSLESRTAFIDYMSEHKISCVFHYLPLHLSDMGRRFGGQEGNCPVTEAISDRLVRLPFYKELSEIEQNRVCATIRSFRI